MTELHTFTDGGQTAADVAVVVADFLAAATKTLDIALYDFNLADGTAATVVGALKQAAARGVSVRLMYNVDHSMPIPSACNTLPRAAGSSRADTAASVTGLNAETGSCLPPLRRAASPGTAR